MTSPSLTLETDATTIKTSRLPRIQSVDMLRGLVMVIMALDHIREFYSTAPFRAEDVTQTTALLFGTRWITHLCAPIFVFLSGVSVYLSSQQKSKRDTSIFLLKRGLSLIFVEIVIMSFLLQFSYQLTLLLVIWAIGCSMIILAALIHLPHKILAVISVVIVAGHNLIPANFDVTPGTILPAFFLHTPFVFSSGFNTVLVAYPILPWLGIMIGGYVVGKWFNDPGTLNTRLIKSGIVLLVLFIVLRATNLYGDPVEWSAQPRGAFYTFLSFMNVTKNPPSLLFISVTIGIGALLMTAFNRMRNSSLRWLEVFGQVPLFYYIVHFALISISAYTWSYFSFGRFVNFSFERPEQWPEGYTPNLLRVYLIWIALVALLYFPCRWYGRMKQQKKYWWMSYL